MRRLIWAVLVLAGLYAGYWALGARAVRAGAEAALAQARTAGWGDAGAVSLAGFPSRFDLTLDGPRLMGPAGRFAWQAPVAQILALSYRPNQLIFWAPPEQALRLSGQDFTLKNTDMRASVRFGLAPELPLAEARLTLDAPALSQPGLGLVLQARAARLALASAPALPEAPAHPAYRIGLEALDLAGPALGTPVPRLTLDAVAALSAPLDRTLAAPPRPEQLRITRFELDWGGKRLAATGDLTIDAQGSPEGTLELQSPDWRDWLAEAEARGLIPAQQRALILGMAEGLARQSGDDTLRLPLGLRGGQAYLGPVVLGSAPRLW